MRTASELGWFTRRRLLRWIIHLHVGLCNGGGGGESGLNERQRFIDQQVLVGLPGVQRMREKREQHSLHGRMADGQEAQAADQVGEHSHESAVQPTNGACLLVAAGCILSCHPHLGKWSNQRRQCHSQL